jgi:beta-fructofuranosidase
VELERPVGLNRKVVLEILVDGDVLVAYANSQVALTTRIYDLRMGALGLFVSEGSAEFANVCLLSRSDGSSGTTTMPL